MRTFTEELNPDSTPADVAPEEKKRRFMEEVEAAAKGEAIPPELADQWDAWQAYNDAESDFKNEHDVDSLKPQERLAVLVLTWGKVNGREEEAEARVKIALGMSEEDAEDAIEEGREQLGIARIDRIKRRLSGDKTEEREVVTDG